jgi:hypothetical protein
MARGREVKNRKARMRQPNRDPFFPHDAQALIIRPTVAHMFEHSFERRVERVRPLNLRLARC